MKKIALLVVLVGLGYGVYAIAGTIVPGQQGRYDKDNNGYPDAGATVTGKYTSVYAYDASGKWYWDLGDGRVQGNVSSLSALNQSTLTTCDYQVQYRGNFENDPYLNSGWIKNEINCKGYDDNGTYNSTIVHKTDKRYSGNPALSIWGEWEYQVNTMAKNGNLARPEKPVNN
jgi:hypothetical protein